MMWARHEKAGRMSATNRKRSEKLKSPASGIDGRLGEHYSKMYICTHGWDAKRKRGKGIVKKQTSRSQGCKAGFNARVIVQDGEYRVVITDQELTHNHKLSQTIYTHYAENRRVDANLIQEADGFARIGGSVQKIVCYLRQKSGMYAHNTCLIAH